MKNLSDIYRPITATPFENSSSYCEIAACEALRPYIRCFWGSKVPQIAEITTDKMGIVIPDTCMDIIFNANYTQNQCGSFFCTVDEHSYSSGSLPDNDVTSTFGIRFYAWSAILFSKESFAGRKNMHFSTDEFFKGLNDELCPMLFDVTRLEEKAAIAEKLLLKRLNKNLINSDLMNAIFCMLNSNGRAKISDICSYTAVSAKKLERLFNYNLGVSPKCFSSLLRYQLLWQDIVFSGDFNVLDAVDKFGYCDQAHLLNDFKKHHLMSPTQAINHAAQTK